jgi:Vestigial/Tondu family.
VFLNLRFSFSGLSSRNLTTAAEDDEDDDEVTSPGGSRAQYVSANCVVFTHYSGDVESVVDEHFSRALSCTSATSSGSATESKTSTSTTKGKNRKCFPADQTVNSFSPPGDEN